MKTPLPTPELVRRDLLNRERLVFYTGPGSLLDVYEHVLNVACALRQMIDDQGLDPNKNYLDNNEEGLGPWGIGRP